jgi:rod shape determining protein RodA
LKAELFKHIDLAPIVSVFFLVGMGLLSIYSATQGAEGDLIKLPTKQLIVVIISAVIMAISVWVPPRLYYVLSYFVYGLALLLLIAVLVFNPGSEPARWLKFGSHNFQPSELAKLGMILALARFLTDAKKGISKVITTVKAVGIIVLPFVLVIVEPDLGTAGALGFSAIPILVVGLIADLHLLLMAMPFLTIISSYSVFILLPLMGLFLLALLRLKVKPFAIAVILCINLVIGFSSPKFWDSLHPYQRQRILTFVNPESEPRGAGYQIIQSKIAIGSGGLLGKGYLQGTQAHLKFLPAGHTDFIFAVFCEEFGFLGATAVLIAFFILVYRGFLIGFKCRNSFHKLFIVGAASHFAFHALINIGMTLGLLPVTGIPLPFMSYGGSALIINMITVGMMVGMGMRWREY